MIIENRTNGLIVLFADEGKKITNKDRSFFSDFIYLGKNDTPDNYEEVGREVWKHFIEDPNPDVVELQAQNKDINETMDVIMTALANSDEQNSTAIDVILLAIDDLYMMLETMMLRGGE
jgi:hypothetical protein